MADVGSWMRTQIACYGAVIAIILEQLDAFPRATVTETPNPLVRIREQPGEPDGWHPDELITQSAGRTYVLVWDHGYQGSSGSSGQILSN